MRCGHCGHELPLNDLGYREVLCAMNPVCPLKSAQPGTVGVEKITFRADEMEIAWLESLTSDQVRASLEVSELERMFGSGTGK